MTAYAVVVATAGSHNDLVLVLCLIGAVSWLLQALPRRIAAWGAGVLIVGCLSGAAIAAMTPEPTNVILMDCGMFGCWFDTIFW